MRRLALIALALTTLTASARETVVMKALDSGAVPATGVWRRVSFAVPAGWANKFVRLDQQPPVYRADACVWVNGKRTGDIPRPGGDLEIGPCLKPGVTNEIAVFWTVSGKETLNCETNVAFYSHNYTRCGALCPPTLEVDDGPVVVDVFANTSAQKGRVDFETTIEAPKASAPVRRVLSVEVLDAKSNTVFVVSKEVTVKGGENVVTVGREWKDPHYWEFGDGYLYTAKVSLGLGQRSRSTKDVTFGFREVWREGRELMMNNHPMHLRIVYPYAGGPELYRLFQSMGFNLVVCAHNIDSLAFPDNYQQLDELDRLGFGCFINCGNMCNIVRDGPRSPETDEKMRRFLRGHHRLTRNHPSVIGQYVCQMTLLYTQIGPKVASEPEFVEATVDDLKARSEKAQNVMHARRLNREWNPNVLYYSHADGCVGDFASANMYLNWIQLQSREELLKRWSEKGTYPYCAIEFGQPYDACWGGWAYEGVDLGQLFLTQYFGDRAYLEEPDYLLNLTPYFFTTTSTSYIQGYQADWFFNRNPLFWEFQKLWVWRTNAAWRGYGHNGGKLYFNLNEAYGYPAGKNHYKNFTAQDAANVKDWANPGYEIHKLGNQDLCAFIGGAGEGLDFADKTHAYWAGEKVEKCLRVIWDGIGARTVSAKVEVKRESEVVWKKKIEGRFKQGEIRSLDFDFLAPQVKEKTSYQIVATFDDGFVDTFDIEVYPKASTLCQLPSTNYQLFLYDPQGVTAGILDYFKVPYRKIDRLANLPADATRLVIGQHALDAGMIPFGPERLRSGLQILVFPQAPEVWTQLGLEPDDISTRQLWVRDAANEGLKGLTPDMLAYWRGYAKWGASDAGGLMLHRVGHPIKVTRHHTVAEVTIKTPSAVGFRPLVVGEIDMERAALLRFFAGTGTITYSLFDFEGRIGVCPAATSVARAVLNEYLSLDGEARPSVKFTKGSAEAARKLGFKVETRYLHEGYAAITNGVASDALRAVGPNLLRWYEPLKVDVLTSAPKGWTILPGGMMAEKQGSDREVLFMPNTDELRARYRDQAALRRAATNAVLEVREAIRRVAVMAGAATNRNSVSRSTRALGWVDGNYWDSAAGRLRSQEIFGSSNPTNGLFIETGFKPADKSLAELVCKGRHLLFLEDPRRAIELGFGLSWQPTKWGFSAMHFTKAPDGFEIFEGGLAARGKVGSSEVFFYNLVPDSAARVRDNASKCLMYLERNARFVVAHVEALENLVRTNLGEEPSDLTVRRVLYRAGSGDFSPMPSVDILSGKMFYRTAINPDKDGCYDLDPITNDVNAVACKYSALCKVTRTRSGWAMLRFGTGKSVKVLVNGRVAFNLSGVGAIGPCLETRIPLESGDNQVEFILETTRAQNRFWALLENEKIEGMEPVKGDAVLEAHKLYHDPVTSLYDPYSTRWY